MSEGLSEGHEARAGESAQMAELARNFVVIQPIIGSKEERLNLLVFRRSNPPEKIDNGVLWARSPMFFYCVSCGHGAARLPELFRHPPPSLCLECQALKELGWLE